MQVTGPLGRPVRAKFVMLDDNTAVIEMASASGLALIPRDRRNPMEATSYGTGELIKKALDMGCRKIIVGIGGSATNDGGLGMAQALGYKFYDRRGRLLGQGGKELINLYRIDSSGIHKAVKSCRFEAACDVKNPLTGKNGAAYVYAPQKGADISMVRELDKGLSNFAYVIKKEMGKNVKNIKGGGAAGGLGAGLYAFLDAVLRPGAEVIIEATGLEKKIKEADLVITGEGSLDMQTFYGKSVFGVIKLAGKYHVPVITINGSVRMERSKVRDASTGLSDGNFSIINWPMTIDEAVKNAEELLASTAGEILTFYLGVLKKSHTKKL